MTNSSSPSLTTTANDLFPPFLTQHEKQMEGVRLISVMGSPVQVRWVEHLAIRKGKKIS